MRAYGLMNTLSAEQEEDARARVEKFLQDQTGSDEELAVLGLRYLRLNCTAKPRRKRQPA
jgi:ribosomal protein S6